MDQGQMCLNLRNLWLNNFCWVCAWTRRHFALLAQLSWAPSASCSPMDHMCVWHVRRSAGSAPSPVARFSSVASLRAFGIAGGGCCFEDLPRSYPSWAFGKSLLLCDNTSSSIASLEQKKQAC